VWLLAPTIGWPQYPQFSAHRLGQSIRAVKTLAQPEASDGGFAVTFLLSVRAPGSADATWENTLAQVQPTADKIFISRANVKMCYHFAHALLC
jgi:hypothetical protein